jgi:hypothetical protein
LRGSAGAAIMCRPCWWAISRLRLVRRSRLWLRLRNHGGYARLLPLSVCIQQWELATGRHRCFCCFGAEHVRGALLAWTSEAARTGFYRWRR